MPISADPAAASKAVTRDDIARIEARIEDLTASIERCRKISLAAKIAFAGGAAWTVLTLLGLVTFEPSYFVAALAAAIGGAVLLGSNRTTWDETEAALRASEALRGDMIGRLDLHVVGGADIRRLH